MGFFILIGLLTVGLIAGSLSGSDSSDDGTDPDPQRDPRIVNGSSEDDDIQGAATDDLIFGQAGNDTISGGDGDDALAGSGGNDTLRGDRGDDVIAGGGGNDSATGGTGNDVLLGGVGDDSLFGEDGDDDLYGVSGNNLLHGNAGNDYISGLDVPNTWAVSEEFMAEIETGLTELYGNAATPEILARVETQLNSHGPLPQGGTSDTLIGGLGNDTLVADSGDSMTGGDGTDLFAVDFLRPDQAFTATGFDPVTISDYGFGATTAAPESLLISYVPGAAGTPAPAVNLAQAGTSVEVRVDDTVVAILQNRVLANVDPASVRLVPVAA